MKQNDILQEVYQAVILGLRNQMIFEQVGVQIVEYNIHCYCCCCCWV